MRPAFERLLRMDMFPLAPRTTVLFGALALVAGLSGAVTFREIGQIRADQEVARALDERHAVLTELNALMDRQSIALLSFLVTGEERHTAALAASAAEMEPRVVRLRQLLADRPEDLARFERMLRLVEQWRNGYARRQLELMTGFTTVDTARALEVTGEPAALLARADEELRELVRIGETEKERLDAALRAELSRIVVSLVAGAVLTLLAAIVAGWWMRRFLFRPIAEITGVLDRLRAGELAVAVPEADRRDEIGVIARAVASFGESLMERTRLEAEAREAAAAAAARAARVGDLQARLGMVVDAALKGDFSARIDCRYEDRDLQELAERVNLLVSGVESELRDLMAVSEALADADLTKRLAGERQGDFARLQDDFNRMVENLTSLVVELETMASDVNATVSEFSVGADELAARTDQQASSLEETAATTEELTASVTQNSEHSRQASGLAREARELAEKGREIAAEAVAAMIRTEQASARMSDITTIIQQIAKQTRSLAINAAVQAKRAGEEGRGFAVVAQEVRMLADRSNDAARDINKLIVNNTQQLGECVELVKRAGKMLETIVTTAQRVESTVHEIASANAQQAHSIKEMSAATVHLDGMTQKNAALAEQSARGARALASRVRDLLDRVAVFRIDSSLRPEARQRPAFLPAAAARQRGPSSGAVPPVPPRVPPAPVAMAAAESWSEF